MLIERKNEQARNKEQNDTLFFEETLNVDYDPETENLSQPVRKPILNHPLIYIADSNESKLIKHETAKMLLKLKWRYWPRIFYYLHLALFLTFVFCYTFDFHLMYTNENKLLKWISFSILIYFLINELCKILYSLIIEKILHYLLSIMNAIEFFNFMGCYFVVFTDKPSIKSSVYSLTVLFSSIIFFIPIRQNSLHWCIRYGSQRSN